MLLKPKRRVNWLYATIALVTALTLWYTVNAKEHVERVVEVRLDYKGLPAGLVITSGQLNKIDVRLRGPLEMLRRLVNRELAYTVDLSGLVSGTNIIPLYDGHSPEDLRIYQVVEVMPPRMTLQVDRILEARLPVNVRLQESFLAPSIRLKDVKVDPAQVLVRGPASIVSKLQRLNVNIPVDAGNENVQVTLDLPVEAPAGVEVVPSSVKVQSHITIQRRVISLQRDVLIDVLDDFNYTVQPPRVTLRVSVPTVSTKDQAYLAQIQAMVDGETFPSIDEQKEQTGNGQSSKKLEQTWTSPVRVSLPDGAQLQRVTPQDVILTRSR